MAVNEKTTLPHCFAPVAFAALAACGFWASAWLQSGGHFMAPLDDVFIHLQYARRLSQGHFFSYSPGDGYSSGATSWLWVFALAPMFKIGLSGVKALAVAMLLSAVLFGAAGGLMRSLGRALTGFVKPGMGFLAALLFLTQGHTAWACLSGMETPLFIFLILWALWGWNGWIERESRGARRAFFVALALLPLARPEGWILWAAALFLGILRAIQHPHSRKDLPLILFAAAPGLAAAILHRALAGQWATNGMVLKGLWGQPHYTWADKASRASRHLGQIAFDYLWNRQPDPLQAAWRKEWTRFYLPPLAPVLAVVGGALGFIAEWRRGRLGALSLAALWWAAGLISVCFSDLPFIHQQRYLAAWTPLCILLALAGLARIARFFDPHDGNFIAGIAAVWIAISLAGMVWWGVEFGKNASDIFHQHRRMSWIARDIVPPNERLALTDTGAIAYYSERPVLDIVGLCSPSDQALAFREGEGSVFERLQNLQPSERPRWIATYPNWWSQIFPLGAAAASVKLSSHTIASAPEMILYRVLPDVFQFGRETGIAPSGSESAWQVVDAVDVADLASEKAHSYRHWSAEGDRPADLDAWPRPWNFLDARIPDPDYLVIFPKSARAIHKLANSIHPKTAPLEADAPASSAKDSLSTPQLSLSAAPLSLHGSGDFEQDKMVEAETMDDDGDITIYDGGRSISGGEEFILRPRGDSMKLTDAARKLSGAAHELASDAKENSKEMALVWRTQTAVPQTLRLSINGAPQPPIEIAPPLPGCWREAWIPISPGAAAKSEANAALLKIRVDFAIEGQDASPHSSFQWRLVQPIQPPQPPARPLPN